MKISTVLFLLRLLGLLVYVRARPGNVYVEQMNRLHPEPSSQFEKSDLEKTFALEPKSDGGREDRGGNDEPPSEDAEPPPPGGMESQSDTRELSGRGGGVAVPTHPLPNTPDPASIHEAISDPVTTEQTTGDLVTATGPSQAPPSAASTRLSAPDQQTVVRQNHSGTRERDDPETNGRTKAKPQDYCEISRLHCSQFFGSPCEQISPANLPEYGGHCHMSRHAAQKQWSACGDVWVGGRSACFCRKKAAVCCANLTAIPDLTRHIDKLWYLNFTSNHLAVLDQHLLRNVEQLKWLILSRNNFSVIHADALNNMKSLERFELAYNQFGRTLDPKNFTTAVNSVRSLKVLGFNHTQFSNATKREAGITWILRHLRLPKLEQLFADGGRKWTFYLSDLDPRRLPKLCKFSIKSHFVRQLYCCSVRSFNDSVDYDDETLITDDAEYPYMDGATHQYSCISPESKQDPYCQHFTLPKLELLNLANNSLPYVPRFCRPGSINGSVESVVPNLTHLLLAINGLINPQRYHFQCLDNLHFLGLTGNPLKTIQSNIFQNLSKLQVADLRFTNVMQVDSHAFQHPSLRFVTIKSSNWFIDQHHEACCISPNLFQGSALDMADLSYNVFKFAQENTTNTFLYPLRTVTTLLMAEVGLVDIPRVILEHFMVLEVLGFQANQMSQIRRHTFDNLTRLKFLDLSDNHIAFPREDILRELIVERLVEVNLESNPFSCTCEMLAFLDLYKAHRGKQPHNRSAPRPALAYSQVQKHGKFVGEHYRCYAPWQLYKHDLESVELTVHNCLLTVSQEIFIYVICLLLIFFLLIYIWLYKYRWQVRFWMYTLHVRLNRGQGERGPGGRPASRPRFKAFVSYCKEDSHFVINEVLPALERNSRLPLCIHERDFIPGRYISQNVVEFMEESRQVLVILSNAFLRSDWCRFELFVAQRYGLVRRQMPVTILMLERLRLELLDSLVVSMLRDTPGVQWPGRQGDARDLALFWQRLGQTLGSRPTPRAIRGGQQRVRPGQGMGAVEGRVGAGRERTDREADAGGDPP